MFTYLMKFDDEESKSKFELLYLNYRASMFNIANAVLRDKGLAEDAVHQAFIKVLRNLHKIDDVFSNKTRSLIVIIVRNTAIDLYRARKKQKTVFLEDFIHEPIHENGTPLDFVIAEESYERMISNISKMPEKYSEVLVLRYFCEYSNGEIAEILNISNGNVRSRLHRARKMLVEIMEEVDFDEQSGIKG